MAIKGTRGNDTLRGTDGDDTIKGGKGADWILGGDGFDVLYGGKGRDVFVIAADDFDAIGDFQSGKDIIVIDAGLYGGGGGGYQAMDPLDYDSPFLSYDGQIVAAVSGAAVGDVLIH